MPFKPSASAKASTLRVLTPCVVFLDHRQQDPFVPLAPFEQRREIAALASLRMASPIVPTRVSHSRSRTPLREVTRLSVRSYGAAPIASVTSASINSLGQQPHPIPKKLRIRALLILAQLHEKGARCQ